MKKEFEPYIRLTNFIGDIMGENTEVVLHDITNLENSIIAIKNNLSGRSIGGPASNFVLQILQSAELLKEDYYCNYEAHDRFGNPLRSSTFFIRNDAGKLIGMMCINTNCKSLLDARNYLDSLIHINEYSLDDKEKITETLSVNTEELTLESISKVVTETGIPPERMSQEEKKDVITKLNSMGIFMIKGSIPALAEILKISESSVYRYLRTIKRNI